MFRKGGKANSQGTGVMSMVEPRVNAAVGYTPIEPLQTGVFQTQQANVPPLSREEISNILYAGKPVPGPTGLQKSALIAQIASTPGSLYDKIMATIPTQLKIAESASKAKAAREETIGKIAAKGVLDERLMKIKSGQAGTKLKRAEQIFETSISGKERIKGDDGKIYYRDPETGISRTEDFYKDQALKQVDAPKGYEGFEARKQKLYDNMISSKPYETTLKKINSAQKNLKRAQDELQKERTKENEETVKLAKQKLDTVQQEMARIENEFLTKPLNKEFPGVRVFKSEGGPIPGTDMTSTPQEFEGLSYDQIRTSLPQTIGDDVVNLLSTNVEALYDFANVSNQDDLNMFNTKYGTDAVLPAQG